MNTKNFWESTPTPQISHLLKDAGIILDRNQILEKSFENL